MKFEYEEKFLLTNLAMMQYFSNKITYHAINTSSIATIT